MAETRKLTLLLVLHQICAIVAMRGYMLTGPKMLMSESIETFCVSIEGSRSEANCSLELMATEDDVVYASTTYWLRGPKDCFKLSVPAISESSARLRWRMQFEGLPDYKVDSIKEVALSQKEAIQLIQTDKAWYTPGQLVRFRILSLDHLLHPILEVVKRVWVEDPTGTTVSQWTNLTTSHGIHQLELQLSSEPVQGLWKIRTDKGEKDFEVREFVLPKFEVILTPPGQIHYNEDGDNSIQKTVFKICGKYSYGQPVRGTWKAVIQVKSSGVYYSWRNRPPIDNINLEKEGVLNEENGCHSLKLSGDQLGISSFDGSIEKVIKVTAYVTELGTGLEMNTTWSTVVERHQVVLDIASWSSSTFKKGLPYYGKVSVRGAGGKPAAGTAVEICAQPQYERRPAEGPQRDVSGRRKRFRHRPAPRTMPKTDSSLKHCAIRLADPDGFISFELLPTEQDVARYDIRATVSRTSVRSRRSILSHLVAASPQPDVVADTQFTIHSSYSPSESYLTFVPPPNYPSAVACFTKLLVKLYFTSDKEINFNLHYLVMARGDVVSTGVRPVNFVEEDNVDLGLGDSWLNKAERGELEPEVEASLKPVGDVEFEIEIPAEFSPKVSLLAYYVRDDGEVVTASMDIPVENCFTNPVALSWSSKRKQPGQNVTMNVRSGPGSVCGYSVVDRSVTFMRPDLQLTESSVYSRLPGLHIEAGSYPIQVTPEWEYCANKDPNGKPVDPTWMDLRRKRSFYPWQFRGLLKDAMEAFDNAGVLVMSDLKIETRPCPERSMFIPRAYFQRKAVSRGRFLARSFSKQVGRDKGGPAIALMRSAPMEELAEMEVSGTFSSVTDEDSYASSADLTSTVAVRTYFPETWLWDLVTLDSDGQVKKTMELPHTVTTWVGQAICVSESAGFGMSSAASIEAFQPFFLEVHLPYSAKRTEQFQIKVSAFNYAPHALPVRVTLGYSEQFELLGEKDSFSTCIPARSNAIHHFLIHATELGNHNVTVEAVVDESFPSECGPEVLPTGRDSVIKELLVQPEGFPMERVYSHMACPQDFEEDRTLVWDLSLPEDLVEGSARAWITAVGDLMGPALQGLSGLVRLPMGCGEQNMILFTPNIYVIQYLEATNQLDPSFKAKAIGYMKSGYQRELTYRHSDGSYSAFGKGDPEGSLWLTAFVVKSFAAARRYIHVDENELQLSVRWLQSKQLENGCFPVVGTVLHKDLKGGLSDSEDLAPLTAFTLISLLEMHSNSNGTSEQLKTLIKTTLPCLKPYEEELPDVYSKALTAYALLLAGRKEPARLIMNGLLKHAQRNDSLLWWEKAGSGLALSVEMTSYVLLSLLKLGDTADLLNARSIVRWLSKQRNSEGGFVSTQDTVVALQAIAAYAAAIGAQPIDMDLLVKAGELEYSIRIQEQSRLVQRRLDLPLPLASDVSIASVSEGDGCAIVQATLRYNVHTPPPSAAFELNITNTETGKPCGPQSLTICVGYSAVQQASNMALLEVGLVSGYEADKTVLEALTRNGTSGIKRYESKADTIVLYFDQIIGHTCVSLLVKPAFLVNDAKEANVKIYDYYQPEHSKSISYRLPSGCVPQNEPGAPPTILPDRNSVAAERASSTEVVVEEIQTEKLQWSSLNDAQPLTQRMLGDQRAAAVRKDDYDREDLQVPDGLEGPSPVFVKPNHSRGCPTCVLEVPKAFPTLYCQSETIFGAETRPSRGNRLRLTNDFSRRHEKPVKFNTSVDLLLEPQCYCSFFDKGASNQSVTILGLPAAPFPSIPGKLMVGPELLIIGKKYSQLKIKPISNKCGNQIRP